MGMQPTQGVCRRLGYVDIMLGHLQRLGKQSRSDGHIEIVDSVPTAPEFYQKYVRNRKPVLFRGAQRDAIAVHRWTDEYLTEKYGGIDILFEPKV